MVILDLSRVDRKTQNHTYKLKPTPRVDRKVHSKPYTKAQLVSLKRLVKLDNQLYIKGETYIILLCLEMACM